MTVKEINLFSLCIEDNVFENKNFKDITEEKDVMEEIKGSHDASNEEKKAATEEVDYLQEKKQLFGFAEQNDDG